MLTQLQIEINELCEIFLSHGRNCIKVSQIQRLLQYKEPIQFKKLPISKIKIELIGLFPLHKNYRKNTKYFRISNKQVALNKKINKSTFRPISKINLESYGIKEDFFKQI